MGSPPPNTDRSLSIVHILKNDLNFHKSVAECCSNKIMKRVLPIITEGLMELYYGQTPLTLMEPGKYYDGIINAIINKNSRLARKHMRLHIVKARKVFNI